MLRLGPLELPSAYLLAPMEAVSDVGFRSLCVRLGAGLAFTEMIRGASFLRENRSTMDLVDTFDGPVGVQFLTKGPDELRDILETFFKLRTLPEYARFKNVKAIDLNLGCPSPEYIRIGAGPALIKRQARMEAILRTFRSVVSENDPTIAIGIKIRLGLNALEKEHKVALRLAPAINEHLDYVVVHGKHAGQRGSEPADWDALREFRTLVSVPFIANGGAFDVASARELMTYTSADGVMIARGAIENPWIFRGLLGGAELATADEVLAARDTYMADAVRYSTKQKYSSFHAENFSRLLAGKKYAEWKFTMKI